MSRSAVPASLGFAAYDPAVDAPRPGHAIHDYDSGPPIERATFAVLLFLATEVMLFAGLLATYLVLRLGSSAWVDHKGELARGPAFAATALLLASSWTLSRGLAGSRTDRGIGARWIWLTIVLGCAFLALQAYEYRALIAAGSRPSTDVAWSCFFVLTGVHGAHVAGGLAWLAWSSIRRTGLRVASLYWHFVDVVWIVLFTVLYVS